MYDPQQTKTLQKLSADLFKKRHALAASSIEDLRDVLRFHEYRYYVQSDPLISDSEYDGLYKQLEKFEKEDPSLITPDSPNAKSWDWIDQRFSKSTAPCTHAFPGKFLQCRRPAGLGPKGKRTVQA